MWSISFNKVMKVVIYGRVSTTNQEYDRQVNELRSLAVVRGWEVAGEFVEKISGAKKNQERPELMKMLDYIEKNEVGKVLVWEMSRLGRNTLQVLDVIEQLTEKKVSVYIKNYDMETLDEKGEQNPMTSFMVTLLAEIAKMEHGTIKERVRSGYKNYREKGGKVGRKPGYRKTDEQMLDQHSEVVKFLKKGYSLREISKLTETSINTIRRVKQIAKLEQLDTTDANPS